MLTQLVLLCAINGNLLILGVPGSAIWNIEPCGYLPNAMCLVAPDIHVAYRVDDDTCTLTDMISTPATEVARHET